MGYLAIGKAYRFKPFFRYIDNIVMVIQWIGSWLAELDNLLRGAFDKDEFLAGLCLG
jgi:hypothetical protein